MIKNYLLVAIRNLVRHRLYSVINIAGLAIALSCAILIVLFVRDELSWDRWLPGSTNLYRLSTTLNYPGRPAEHFAITAFPLLAAVKENVPEVLAATHIVPEDVTIGAGGNQFYETAQVVDPGFFQVIKLPFVEGSPAGVFAQPNSAVISQSAARKYFGTSDPLRKIITVSGTVCATPKGACQTSVRPLVVRGVVRDLPHNSQLVANVVFPTTSAADEMSLRQKENWTFLSGYSYISLAPGSDAKSITQKINQVIDRSFDAGKVVNLKLRGSEFEHIHLTRFWDVHLSTEKFNFDMKQAGSPETVYGIAAIAVLILLIAAFNYTNLTVAQANLRAKEIALRKCFGAQRRQVALQFLGESILLALLSFPVALSIVEAVLPLYNRVLARPLQLHYLDNWRLFLGFGALTFLVGLLSGIYPALILSGIKPAVSLRKGTILGGRSAVFRTGLIALQFAVSIGLGVVTITIFSQTDFERKIALGFKHGNVLVAESGSGMAGSARESFVQAIASLPAVEKVAVSTTAPFANAVISGTHVHVPGNMQDFVVIPMSAGPEYPVLYGMRLLSGRLLSRAYASDRFSASGNAANEGRNILVNESAARLFGLGAGSAVGKSIIMADGSHVTIVGILGDSLVDGAARSASPTVYFYNPETAGAVSIKVRDGQMAAAIGSINKVWKDFAPESAIQMRFLSRDFEVSFNDLERRGLILGIFVVIAIVVACLGLFGVAAFSVERRTREIGVRKVFGARSRDIVRLLMRQFSIPILIASLIAWPVTYFYLHGWLEQYPSRISLNPLHFAAASLAALFISSATVFVHARRVAGANPIQALRYE
jgi:putative ABC transport system permease protein